MRLKNTSLCQTTEDPVLCAATVYTSDRQPKQPLSEEIISWSIRNTEIMVVLETTFFEY